MTNEELFKEIDLIQGCINRMANNSFLVKGWALGVFAGVTAITKGANLNSTILFICTTIVPFVCFWILDAFFLQAEKKYRKMYAERLEMRKNEDDNHLYELDPKSYKVDCIFKIMWSTTLSVFYGIPFLASIVVIIIEHFDKLVVKII